ncbi:MAG: MobV family relaxase [Rikenellaceae bacterium]
MGFAVVHLEKAKGADSGMSAHIERTIDPKNADKERTHLNKELIDFPDGVENRTQAIQHRLDNAGLTRKIGTNQVRAIRVLLTGSHEDMAKIEQNGQLDNWCNDNLDWLRQTYGSENLVSAVLHLDEKTPHIHATIIPIVTTERKRRKREEVVKKKYKQKAIAPRLCSDEVMSRLKLKEYQNTYAEAMQKYGLERGIEGSTAKHVSTSKYYRDLIEQSENIQQDITSLLELKEREQTELSKIRADQSKEKLKNSAADVGSKVMDSVSSMLGTPKVKRLESENAQLKSDIAGVRTEIEQVKINTQQQIVDYKRQTEKETTSLKEENKTLKEQLSRISNIFPRIGAMLKLESFLEKVGFTIEMIRRLFNREQVRFHGKIYSHEYNRHFETKESVASLVNDPDLNNNLSLQIDNKDSDYWFRDKYRENLKAMGIEVREPQQRRGLKR